MSAVVSTSSVEAERQDRLDRVVRGLEALLVETGDPIVQATRQRVLYEGADPALALLEAVEVLARDRKRLLQAAIELTLLNPPQQPFTAKDFDGAMQRVLGRRHVSQERPIKTLIEVFAEEERRQAEREDAEFARRAEEVAKSFKTEQPPFTREAFTTAFRNLADRRELPARDNPHTRAAVRGMEKLIEIEYGHPDEKK